MIRMILIATVAIANASLCFASDLAPPDMTLTPDILEALDAMSNGKATEPQAALLFKNNDKINRARLNDWISNKQYQSAQNDFAQRNKAFAKNASDAVVGDGNFTSQASKPGKPKSYSAGTDSDYIIRNVTDPQQVTRMQQVYNQSIDKWLKDQDALDRSGTNWNNRLDVDFMADPSKLTADQFKQIAVLNNDAYKRQLAADYERISRGDAGQPTEVIAPGHVSAYAQEMQDFINKKQELLNKLRADPNKWSDPAFEADIYRKMAQEQKYIERIESLTDTLRKQNGLDPIVRDPVGATDSPYKSPYTVTEYSDGTSILIKRSVMDADGNTEIAARETGSIAQRGAIRTPENKAQTLLGDAVSENSLSRGVSQLSETWAQLAGSDPEFRSTIGEIASFTSSLSPAERGLLLENIRRIAGDGAASDVARAMRESSPPSKTDPSVKSEFAQASEQGSQIAAQTPPAGPNSLLDVTRQVDQSIAESIGLSSDLSNMSVTRRQMNELAGKLPDINGLLNAAFMLNEAAETGSTLGLYFGNLSLAMDPSTPDAVADQHFAAMDALARQLIAKGVFGAAFAQLMEAFPTAGAVVGTYMASYNGTRWVLENTRTGQIIDRAAGQAFDGLFTTRDSLIDTWNGWTGGETKASRDTKQRQRYIDIYNRALQRGTIGLREGVTMQQLVDALNAGTDISVINRTLLKNRPAPSQGSASTADEPVNCRKYCLDNSGYSPGSYMNCVVINKSQVGTEAFCQTVMQRVMNPGAQAAPAAQAKAPGPVVANTGSGNPPTPPAPGLGATPATMPQASPVHPAGAPPLSPNVSPTGIRVRPTPSPSTSAAAEPAHPAAQPSPDTPSEPPHGAAPPSNIPPRPMPIAPTQQAEPSRPPQQALPVKPVQQALPAQPVQPTLPVKPVQQALPAQPVQPTLGVEPVQPTLPPKQVQQALPVEPVTPRPAVPPVAPPQKPLPQVALADPEPPRAPLTPPVSPGAIKVHEPKSPPVEPGSPKVHEPKTAAAPADSAPPASWQRQPAPAAPRPASNSPTCSIDGGNWDHGSTVSRGMTVTSRAPCTKEHYDAQNYALRICAVPRNGNVAIQGEAWTYLSNDGFKGSDSFAVCVTTPDRLTTRFNYAVTVID